MTYSEDSLARFLGGFFIGLLALCLVSASFAGFTLWRGQSVSTVAEAQAGGASDDQQGAGAERAVEEAPPTQ